MKTPPVSPERILVRGVNWLGDAVMTTPALLRLRQACPAAVITLCIPEKLADLWKLHPAVDEVLPLNATETFFGVSRRLKAGDFDVAVILPNSPRSALEAWLAGIPVRVGLARPWRNQFLTCRLPEPPGFVPMRKRPKREILALNSTPPSSPAPRLPPQAHHMRHYLHIVAALGADPAPIAPVLRVSPEEVIAVQNRFSLGMPEADDLFLGLNPGAEYGPAKRWPKERFVEAAALIQQKSPANWLVFGGPRDMELCEWISGQMSAQPAFSGRPGSPIRPQIFNLAGQTSLRELCAALKLCRVLLTNDSGPMHVAAALEVPVVALFGSTSPELTGPGLPGDPRHHLLRHLVPCAPCFQRVCPIEYRCLNQISSPIVAAAVCTAAMVR